MTLKELNKKLDDQIKALEDMDMTNPVIVMRTTQKARAINDIAKVKVNIVSVSLQNEKIKKSSKGADDLIG